MDALRLRRVMGRDVWSPPAPFGPDGWQLSDSGSSSSVIVTCSEQSDGIEWVHASIARRDVMPSHDDLTLLHRAVWGERGYAYQVFAPASQHVNIHEHALHLWGRLDGRAVLPEFGALGTI